MKSMENFLLNPSFISMSRVVGTENMISQTLKREVIETEKRL